jgi:phosphoenolpyruvate carboxykinase (ATP)
MPVFNLAIPKRVRGVESRFLNPLKAWPEKRAWDEAALELAAKFIANFEKYTDNEFGKSLVEAGPKIDKG